MECEICGKRVGSWSKVIINNIVTCGSRPCMNSAHDDNKTADQRRRSYRRNSGVYDKICEQCGESYHAFRRDQRYCSDECKILGNNHNIWGNKIKNDENVDSSFYASHHILPKSAFPELADDIFNGVPLPKSWHVEFHAATGGYAACGHQLSPFRDWAGLLFKFIEEKIIESKLEMNTLDQWF